MDILRMLKIVSDAEMSIKWAPQPRLKLEMTIAQLASIDSTVRIEELISKIEKLERKIDPGNFNTSGRRVEDSSAIYSAQVTQKQQEDKSRSNLIEQLRERWDEIVERVRTKSLTLSTALKLSSPVEIKNYILRIGSPDIFNSDVIKRNKNVLSDEIQRLTGVKLGIESFICDVNNIKEEAIKNNPELKARKLASESPFVNLLIKNLGAKPIE
jgi:DNA polymerase-3 subunit gamma/tau